ncbi:hypothetical protein SAMN05216389_103224 [Oceanobacillus limi]|uniref:Zinc-ribbon domain-containing protein n=1 Tax=Oceanobacillus limi TaxID=930131 RepID=A0A1I0AFE3_9BACI|nr:zinc ribbon domain-containing protein [Oceanobacillus limi]SES92936.1 hypothetical protein SAMN05216389_103224 [Oceanobacillus limi]
MNFCTQCGTRLEHGWVYCGNCGVLLHKDGIVDNLRQKREMKAISSNDVEEESYFNKGIANSLPKTGSKGNKNVVKGIVVLAIVSLFLIFINLPKEMSEAEYAEYVIDFMVNQEKAFSDFHAGADEKGLYGGEWTEEFHQLEESAEQLQQYIEKSHEQLQNIKPPEGFQTDHEEMLQVSSAYETAATNLVSYIETGDIEQRELMHENQGKAYEFFNNTTFSTPEYEDQLMDKYSEVME